MLNTSRRRILAVVATIGVLASGATAQQDVRERLRDTQEQLDSARSSRDVVSAETDVARAQLAAADERLHAMEVQLREREAELVAAEAALADANARTAEVNTDLIRVNGELSAVRAELAEDQDQFDARVAAAYKRGGYLPYAQALLRADDFNELVTSGYYVRSVMRADRASIDVVTDRTAAVVEMRSEIDALREDLAAEQRVAAEAEAEVARRAETHRQLTTMVGEERAARAQLLTRLEDDLATHTQLVSSLETASAELERELQAELARQAAAAAAASAVSAPIEGDLLWPTAGRAGSPYGWRVHPIHGTRRMHTGVDISGHTGQPIIAAAAGRVVSAGWRGGYGLAVVIDHGGGLATLYAHQSVLAVRAGQPVSQGQKIGEVGSTGYSTGPHLHYEVRVNGTPQDPMRWYG